MELGAFSISLAVKTLDVSRQFYEKFGFKVFGRPIMPGVPRSRRLPSVRRWSRKT
jgi:hypothetical protein